MAKSSLTYISGFSVKFCFQPIYADYANWAYFDKRSQQNFTEKPEIYVKLLFAM
jgi:hypothetical protein